MIDHKTYMELPKRYFADPVSEFMPFGEWFVRKYLKKQHDSELFYEKDMMSTGTIIGSKYLKKENDNDTI